jgi:DNA-binding Xre family transcriptional regulator
MPSITITKQVTQEEEISVTLNQYVGHQLAVTRKEKKMKQRELAKKVGYINISYLSLIEKGHRAVTLERLESLCKALGCKSSDILPF